MNVTIVENQGDRLKKKIKIFFVHTQKCRTCEFCVVKDVLASSLDKWSLFIVYNLGFHQVLRFNELQSKIDGISARMLSSTLKKLENHDILTRKVYAEVPPRVEYQLTTFGYQFADKLIDLSGWYVKSYKSKLPLKSV